MNIFEYRLDFCLHVFEIVLGKYLGEKAPDREDIYQNFGMNEPGVLRHYIGRSLPEAEADFYRIHREKHLQFCPETYPGCREFLQHLKEKGLELSILTGRSETTCQISMEVLGLGGYFSAFQYGSPEKNDKTGQLLKLMREKNLKNDELFYIGDAVSDVLACHRAQVRCLAAAWAKSARVAELENINPGLVFTSVESMQCYIDKLI